MIPSIDDQQEKLLSECKALVRLGIWPHEDVIAFGSWLKSFDTYELPYAIDILRGFCFFNEKACIEMLATALNKAIYNSCLEIENNNSCDAEIFCLMSVDGEAPNDTDSGKWYLRKARKVLHVGEEHILKREKVVEMIKNREFNYKKVIFVDDILGSGSQLASTLTRPDFIETLSISDYFANPLYQDHGTEIIYAPLIATELGIDRIATRFPEVRIEPCHILDSRSSTIDCRYRAWRPKNSQEGPSKLKEMSIKRGFTNEDPGSLKCWSGFAGLGLGLAFHDSVPDLNIQLFQGESPNLHKFIEL